MQTDCDALPYVHEATPDEGAAILDQAAREQLGMSGKQFLNDWDRNVFSDQPERTEVLNVAMLVPFAR